jgi:hypothetical protein
MLQSVDEERAVAGPLDERVNHMAQFLTALVNSGSCSFYTSESDELIMEIRLAGASWTH